MPNINKSEMDFKNGQIKELKGGAAFAAPRGQRGGLNEVVLIIINDNYLCCV